MFNRQHYVFTILAMSLALAGTGQNIVPNSGFETGSGLPSSLGQWGLCQNWSNAGSVTADPDYYHVAGSASGDLPVTPAAIVNPRSGSAIMGLLVFNKFQPDFREYLSIQFSEPMIPGEKYLVSFFITNGLVTDASNAGIGISKFGALLSVNSPVQSGNDLLNETPQFTVSNVLYDRNWRKIQFTLTADLPYEHLTIGLFHTVPDVQFAEVEGTHPSISYYFVDDFLVKYIDDEMLILEPEPDESRLVPDPNDVISDLGRPGNHLPFFIPNSFTPNGDGVNDTFCPVITDLSNFEFAIYDRWGSLIFKTSSCTQGWDGDYQGDKAEAGLYVWQISYWESGLQDEKEVKSCRGSVNLLR